MITDNLTLAMCVIYLYTDSYRTCLKNKVTSFSRLLIYSGVLERAKVNEQNKRHNIKMDDFSIFFLFTDCNCVGASRKKFCDAWGDCVTFFF